MIVLLHVIIALASMAHTAVLYLWPSAAKLRIAYVLLTATLGSGFYLVATMNASILKTCLMGILYLGIVSYGIAVSQRKLTVAKQPAE